MSTSVRSAKILRYLGALCLGCNLLGLFALALLTVGNAGRAGQALSAWGLLLFPALGVLAGYWLWRGTSGWIKGLVIATGITCSIGLLFVMFIVGPQLDNLENQHAKQLQIPRQELADKNTERMFLGVYAGDIDIVREMLDKGVDVNARNETHQTPLHVTQNVEIARLLINRGADLTAKDDSGSPPIFNKEFKIAGILLDAGVDMNDRNEKGNTLLLWYAYSGYLDGIKYLVARGADVDICNLDHHNVLDIATHFQPNSATLRYLQALNIQPCRP